VDVRDRRRVACPRANDHLDLAKDVEGAGAGHPVDGGGMTASTGRGLLGPRMRTCRSFIIHRRTTAAETGFFSSQVYAGRLNGPIPALRYIVIIAHPESTSFKWPQLAPHVLRCASRIWVGD